jgi:tetratricopeptide (TPR) repeat protein
MGELKVTRRFLLKKTEVPDSDWDGFKKLAKAVSDDEFNFLPLSGVGNGVVGSSQDGTVDLDRKFNEGTKALQRRDFQRAKELFQQVLAAEPKYRGAHFNLGMACVSQNQPTEGLAEFHKEEEVSPDDTQSMQAAAKLEMYLHRDEDAMQDWKKVQKVDPKNHDAALAIGQFLSSQEKYSEAAEVLEDALQSAPDSPSLRVLLGDAYLKGGKFDKAFPLLRAAADGAEKSKTVDSMILNNIAYELAEANTSLDFAKQCAEKALAELDSQSSSPSGRGLRLTQQYSPAWDTAGWVYFKLGDYKRAENYVHASWLLGQQRTVGEHLGEIYEKLGMPKEAAHVYELAYVAGGASMPGTFGRTSPARVLKGYEGSEKTLKERYHKLTGKALEDSTFSIHRSPNGQWPVSPSEELSRMREVKLGTHSGPSGSADFELIFAVGEPAVVKFVGGSDAMRSMSARLAAAKFRLEFPMDAKATLVRRVTLHCGPYEACSAVMMPLD